MLKVTLESGTPCGVNLTHVVYACLFYVYVGVLFLARGDFGHARVLLYCGDYCSNEVEVNATRKYN